MAITLPSGFNITNNEPGDSRVVVANQSARLGFSAANVYKGMLVFQQDTQELYVLIDNTGPSINANWIKLVTADTVNQYSGSFSGSFQGDGAGLTNLPASSIVGLNLTQISDSQVSASVSSTGTSFTVVSASVDLLTVDSTSKVTATTFSGSLIGESNTTGSLTGSFTGVGFGDFSGSFEGDGNGLTNIPAASIVGLNLTQIATGLVTASVAGGSTAFSVVSGSSTLLRLTNAGDLHVSASEIIGKDITATGNAIITGSLTTVSNTLLKQDLTVEGTTSFLNNVYLTGSLEISQNLVVQGTASFGRIESVTGSAKIIGDAFIILNSNVPAERYAGILVEDSGSLTGQTGSLLYDAELDHWFYDSTAEGYASGFIAGPRASRDNITWPSRYAVTRGDGGNHIVNSNIYSTGSYVTINKGGTGSLGTEVDILGSVIITGSTIQSSPLAVATTAPDSTGNYALVTSQSAWFYNHNAGVPRSNAWKSSLNGSYFNNFDHNTNVSEILRFMAGLLSASAPSPTPNTKYYNALSETKSNTGTVANPTGFVPQSSTNSDIIYLSSKGWAQTGSSIFNGLTIYNNSNYYIRYNSVAGGSTAVSSSVDSELFGLGALDEYVKVSGSITFNFEQANDTVVTATSSSQQLIQLLGSAPESSGGAQKNKINTANPAVIPAAYQDGKFVNVFQSNLYNGGISFTSISSSGYYEINATVGIQTGSETTYLNKSAAERIFWSEVADGDFAQNTITHQPTFTALTATSRSLSGAPYLQTATWNYQDTASGVFNPLYYEASPIFSLASSNGLSTIGGTTSQAMSGGNISGTSLIYDSTGATQRSAGTVPFETDIIKTSNTVTFNAGTSENIGQTSISPTTFTVTATAEDRDGTNIASGSTIYFHEAGTFAQPATSGTLAYYGQAQGYDGGTFTRSSAGSLIADFTGEDYRLQIDDNILSGSYSGGTAWDTTFQVYNLAGDDLQIKPGYLVKPGGTYAYWLTDPDPAQTYKYYAVAFNRNLATNQPSITMTLGGNTSLVEWTATTSGSVAALIIPESVLGTVGQASGIDPKAASTNLLSSADGRNPFGRSLNVLANSNSQKTNPFIIDFPTSPNAFPLNTTYRNFVVLIRYIGDPTPLTSITLTVTA